MRCKKLFYFFVFLAVFLVAENNSYAQLIYPAKWTFSVENKTASEATLVFKVKLDEGWHMYSQFTPAGGPLPMVFTFEPNKCYEILGKVSESKPEVEFDSTFEVKVFIFHHQAS